MYCFRMKKSILIIFLVTVYKSQSFENTIDTVNNENGVDKDTNTYFKSQLIEDIKLTIRKKWLLNANDALRIFKKFENLNSDVASSTEATLRHSLIDPSFIRKRRDVKGSDDDAELNGYQHSTSGPGNKAERLDDMFEINDKNPTDNDNFLSRYTIVSEPVLLPSFSGSSSSLSNDHPIIDEPRWKNVIARAMKEYLRAEDERRKHL